MLQKIKYLLRLFTIKKDQAIYTCLKNDIPLTRENVSEVRMILKQKEKIEHYKEQIPKKP